jgi:hypothetical protein
MDATDLKFEDALKEVAEGIDQYTGMMKDNSNKLYEDFNKDLKGEFGKNLEQIQAILNNLRTELDQNNEKFVEVSKSINEVDVEN